MTFEHSRCPCLEVIETNKEPCGGIRVTNTDNFLAPSWPLSLHLGPTLARVCTSWPQLSPSWPQPASMLTPHGRVWARPGINLARLASTVSRLRAILAHDLPDLAPTRPILVHLGPNFAHPAPCLAISSPNPGGERGFLKFSPSHPRLCQ